MVDGGWALNSTPIGTCDRMGQSQVATIRPCDRLLRPPATTPAIACCGLRPGGGEKREEFGVSRGPRNRRGKGEATGKEEISSCRQREDRRRSQEKKTAGEERRGEEAKKNFNSSLLEFSSWQLCQQKRGEEKKKKGKFFSPRSTLNSSLLKAQGPIVKGHSLASFSFFSSPLLSFCFSLLCCPHTRPMNYKTKNNITIRCCPNLFYSILFYVILSNCILLAFTKETKKNRKEYE